MSTAFTHAHWQIKDRVDRYVNTSHVPCIMGYVWKQKPVHSRRPRWAARLSLYGFYPNISGMPCHQCTAHSPLLNTFIYENTSALFFRVQFLDHGKSSHARDYSHMYLLHPILPRSSKPYVAFLLPDVIITSSLCGRLSWGQWPTQDQPQEFHSIWNRVSQVLIWHSNHYTGSSKPCLQLFIDYTVIFQNIGKAWKVALSARKCFLYA